MLDRLVQDAQTNLVGKSHNVMQLGKAMRKQGVMQCNPLDLGGNAMHANPTLKVQHAALIVPSFFGQF